MTVVTNTETRPGGAPWKYAPVTVGLVGSGFLNTGEQITGNWKQQADATGAVSYDLDPNNAGEYYVWNGPDGRQYNFVVPSTGGPYTLGALVTTTIPAAQQGVTPDALTQRLSSYAPVAEPVALTKAPGTADWTNGVTGAVQRSLLAKTADTMSVKDFGAKGDGTTDDTTAIQTAINWVTATSATLYFPRGTYLISAHLLMGNVNGGSSRWRIFAYGATIQQNTDNTPIFHFTKESTYLWGIHGGNYSWTNNQTAAQTSAIAFYFDSDTDLGAGWYNFDISNVRFLNGFRGITLNEGSANRQPIWGGDIRRVHSTSLMKGAAIRLRQTTSGQPNMSFKQIYVRGDVGTETLIDLQGYKVVTVENLEFNNTITQEVLFTTCEAVIINGIRTEAGSCTSNNNGIWTFSDTRVTINGIEAYNKTINVTNWVWLIRIIGSNAVASIGNITTGSITLTSGQFAVVQGNDAGDISFPGNYNNGSSSPLVYRFDNTPNRVSRGRGIFGAVKTITANYTITNTDDIILSNISGGGTITLPATTATATGVNRQYTIKNLNAAAITVSPAASPAGQTIDGAATVSLAQYQTLRIVGDGSSAVWSVLGNGIQTDFSASNLTVGKILTANASGATATSCAALAGAGTGGSVALVSGSNDSAGTLVITTGTSTVTGDLATITFGAAYPTAPIAVILTPQAGNWYTAQPYVDNSLATTGFKIKSNGVPPASASMRIMYDVRGKP